MKRLIVVIAVVATLLPAQQTQLGSCVAFNDAPTASVIPINLCNTTASVSFVAAATFTVTEIEIFAQPAGQGFCASVSDSVNGSSGVVCGPGATFSPPKWWTLSIPAFTVSAGSTCTLAFSPFVTSFGAGNALTAYSNPGGTSPMLLSRACAASGACAFTSPCQLPPAMETLMFRLRGPACSGGSPATVTSVGTPCGSTAPTLLSLQFPVVGASGYQLVLTNAPTGFAGLFLAEGSAATGTPVEPGHPCVTYLQAASFDYLNALGYEPLATAVVSLGSATFAIPIPPVPALIGLHVTVQAAITGSGGIPLATVPGVSVMVSNALVLTVGS